MRRSDSDKTPVFAAALLLSRLVNLPAFSTTAHRKSFVVRNLFILRTVAIRCIFYIACPSMDAMVSRLALVALIRTTSSMRFGDCVSRSVVTGALRATENRLTRLGRSETPRDTAANPKAKLDVFDNDLLKLGDAGGCEDEQTALRRRRRDVRADVFAR